MIMIKCQLKIVDLYNTSLGMVVILEFPENLIPQIGMELRKDTALWKITHVGMKDVFIKSERYKQHVNRENLWACTLMQVGNSSILQIHDVLYCKEE